MKKKETIRSLWTPTAGMLTGARRAAMLLVMLFTAAMATTATAQKITITLETLTYDEDGTTQMYSEEGGTAVIRAIYNQEFTYTSPCSWEDIRNAQNIRAVAIPNPGFKFEKWEVSGEGVQMDTGSQEAEITSVTADVTLTAVFVRKDDGNGSCGENVTWYFESSTTTLTISGTGAMANYNGQNMPWLAYKDDITTVVIEAGVTSIGNKAFYSFTKLESVTIPASVTQIGDVAFYGCTNLATVSGASGVTKAHQSTIFAGTAWLNNLPDGLTYVGHVAYIFKGEGTSVELSDGTTQIAENAFAYSKITSISIPASVTFIGANAFAYSALTSVTIPASVTYIGENAFAYSALEKIYSLATSAPTLVNNAFQGCHDLTDVIVPATAYDNDNYSSWSQGLPPGILKPGYTVTCDEGITTTAGPLVVEGETVTLAYSGTVPEGYTFVYTVKDADENDVTATVLSGTTLTMPSYNITVTGTTEICTPSEIEITSANFTDYFDYNGDFEYSTNATPTTGLADGGSATKGGYFLKANVAAESTLDFKGDFIPDASGNYNPRIFINKRVNITSSDKDAVFKPYISNDKTVKLYWNFGILEGADYTEVKNLKFKNCWVFNHGSSYVTFDGIDLKVEDVRISSIGALSIRTLQDGAHASDHTTVKNSVFYIRNNGGYSCISAACGAPYATFDNNTFTIEGEVGNVIYVSRFNSNDNFPAPEFATFTNNEITNLGPAQAISWCIVPFGQGNLVENNTVNYEGIAINTVYGSSVSEESAVNTYRNNTTTLGGTMSVYEYSVVENNQVSGKLTVAKGATVTGNTVAGMTVSGQDATVKSNTVNGSTTISGTNVTFQGNTVNGNTTISRTTASFTDNAINGTLTLNSAGSGANDNNTITGNVILSTMSYAVELKSLDNTVSGNILISADHEGDDAVHTTKSNTIADNTLAAYESATASSQSNTPYIITSETTAIKAGDNAGTFYYVPTDATVTINGDLAITPNEGATSPKVNLMHGNGSQLNVGNISGSDCSLTLYGQSMDGMLTATGTISAKNINLNGATVTANGYSGTVTIASGKTYYDGTGASYTGTLTSSKVTAIAGKTLRTYDYRTVEYVDADGTMATADARPLKTDHLPSGCGGWNELPGGWYVVENWNTNNSDNNGVDFYRTGDIIFNGDTHLILCDGAEMNVSKDDNGTTFQSEGTLTIYGQSGGSGRLSATNTNTDTGGNGLAASDGLTINGGTVNTTAPDGANAIYSGKNVAINGGTVIANGTIDSYNNSVTIAEGMIDCTTGTKRVIANGITDDVSNALKGQTVDIFYSRTYTTGSGSGKASTLCLPFAFEAKADDGIYATFSEVTETAGVYEVKMTEVDAGTMLTAGTPYMFVPKTSDKLTQGNAAFTVPVEGFAGASSATNGSWQFKGTFEKKTWESGQTNLYGFAGKEYYLSNGSQIASDDIGSFRRFDYGTCAAFRCYLLAPESSGARGVSKAGSLPETLKVRLVKADGTTTAIGTLDTRTGEVEFGDDWYDLNGRRLDVKPTAEGVYINNGKKIVIKN